jgi:hypothetical protein
LEELRESNETLKIIHLGKESKVGPHENEADVIITIPQCPVTGLRNTAKSGDSGDCGRVNSLSATSSLAAEMFQSGKRETTKIRW